MIFVNTERFRPVSSKQDLPWDEDYFHLQPTDITDEFLEEGNFIIDEGWWNRQFKYCTQGFSVPNAIQPGGDCIVDGIDAIWNHTKEDVYNREYEKVIPPNSCYLPNYDLMIVDRTVHISGRFYFYLNFWPIYGLEGDSDIKTLTKPKFLDMDFLFARRLDMMQEQKKDNSELKARQKGFSEKLAGMIAGWNYTFVKSSITIIVAGEDTDADHTMDNTIRGLDDIKNTQFYKVRAKGFNSKDVVRSKNARSEVRKLTAKDKTQAVSRYSPYWVIYEEVGKWKAGQVKGTKGFVNASTSAEGKKTGYSTFVGTGGDMEAGAADLEDMHYNPKKHGMLSFKNTWEEPGSTANTLTGHFTPAYFYAIIDKDGNSLKQKSIEYYNKLYEEKTVEEQYTHKTQHPFYASDAFKINTGGFFGKHIIELLNIRKSFIQTHQEARIEQVGRLVWINPKRPFEGVRFVEDPEGWFHMFEEPECDENGKVFINLYKTATDSYDQDESTTDSKGSWQCFKSFNPLRPFSPARKYVARITERPKTEEGGSETFYEHTAMGCIFYGIAINLIEYSKIRIIDWYDKNGFTSLLKERPEFVSASMIIKSKTSNRWGIDPATKPHWLYMLKDELTEDFINRMDDIYQIERLAKFRYDPTGKKYNCDTTITSALDIVLEKDEEGLQVMKSQKSETKKEHYTHFVTVNGQIVEI